MRLHRLHLLNFRQHADTDLVFGPGITGIIGPNGSGKTTLLEAIAWAIYISIGWAAPPGSRADAAPPAPPAELPPARRHRPRVRAGDHGDHRPQRVGEDDAARGDRLGDLRQCRGAGR
ncbi:MAG: hypothetical protein DMD31_03490 [Gemmatimonadetes bacterium]|nr:MAG: hypothetical protein DMD31_03490 [Gemmatimonadota bacterium]